MKFNKNDLNKLSERGANNFFLSKDGKKKVKELREYMNDKIVEKMFKK